jgi:hypothetical protein
MCISIWFEVVWPFVAKPLQTFKEQRSVAFNSFEAEESGYDSLYSYAKSALFGNEVRQK